MLSCLGRAGKKGGRLHELHIVEIAKLLSKIIARIISKNTSQWMTTAIYEIMNKLVPNIMEMRMFLCMQITDKLFKFLNNSLGSKAVF